MRASEEKSIILGNEKKRNILNESSAIQNATHSKNPTDVGLWLFYVLIKTKKVID